MVPLDLDFPEGARVVLLSGPNAGGKTVALKTLGLAALMAQAGIPVLADAESTLPELSGVWCHVGDEQDLLSDLSTFSAAMRATAALLASADAGTLVLYDELGSGTDPEEGAALAAALLEELVAAALLDARHRPPHHRRRARRAAPGRGQRRHGVRREQRPPDLQRCRWAPRAARADSRSRSAAASRRRSSSAPARCCRSRSSPSTPTSPGWRRRRSAWRASASGSPRSSCAAAEARGAAEAEQRRLESEREALRQRLGVERERLRAARRRAAPRRPRRAASRRGSAARFPSKKRLAAVRRVALDLEDEVAATRAGARPSRPARRCGCAALRGEGVGQERGRRPRRGACSATSGCGSSARRASCCRRRRRRARSTLAVTAADEAAASELKLIGLTQEEARDELERFLDRALIGGVKRVRVVHGHGSGALRRLVREFFGKHPAVASFAHPPQFRGGTGVTEADLE